MEATDWPQIHGYILELEQRGLVTRTFRRLDPERQQAILSAILEEVAEKGPAQCNTARTSAKCPAILSGASSGKMRAGHWSRSASGWSLAASRPANTGRTARRQASSAIRRPV